MVKRNQSKDKPHDLDNKNARDVIVQLKRDVPPSHYLLKIDSFSMLFNSKYEKHDSCLFESGGYKWKLSLYPKGNNHGNGKDHISLYLVIANTNTLPPDFEVNVNFKFFVYDHIHDNYLTIQELEIKRFHKMKTEWGYDQLLPISTFIDPNNGYLVNDSCAFGVEVFVVKYGGKGESFSIIKNPADNIYTWKIERFSKIVAEYISSQEFVVGESKWKLLLYPKHIKAKRPGLSVYLSLANAKTQLFEHVVLAKCELRILDQTHKKSYTRVVENKFCDTLPSWGWWPFITLNDLNDASKGFLVNDTLIIEAQFLAIYICKVF